MKLYFLRHGEATYPVGSDESRVLTEAGSRQVTEVIADRISELGDLDTVLTSPYRRTRQTAEIVTRIVKFKGDMLVCAELAPSGNIHALSELLKQITAPSVMLVMHQPLIGNIVAKLTDETKLRVIEPGWLVALETDIIAPGFANFRWLQKPTYSSVS
jgi:phosphohistidine phosphatase